MWPGQLDGNHGICISQTNGIFCFHFFLYVHFKLCPPPLGITYCVLPHIFFISCGLMTLLWWLLLRICIYVRYIPFNVSLNLYIFKLYMACECPLTYLLFIIPGLLFSEFDIEKVILFSICANPSFDSVIKVSRKSRNKYLKYYIQCCLHLYNLYSSHLLHGFYALYIFQIFCYSITKNVPVVSNHVHFVV